MPTETKPDRPRQTAAVYADTMRRVNFARVLVDEDNMEFLSRAADERVKQVLKDHGVKLPVELQ